MNRGLAAVLVVLGSAPPALGQSAPRPPEVIIDVDHSTPEGQHGDSTRVPLPPEGPARQAFLQEFILVHPRENQALQAGRALSASEFYRRVNRPDLAAYADDRARQRIWLMAGSAVVLVAGVAGGVVVLSNAQSLNDPRCFANGNFSYNDCVDRHQSTTNAGAAIIAVSTVIAAGLFTWGILIPEMVTPPEETVRLATEYNRALGQKYGVPKPSATNFHLLPAFAPGYAGLTAQLRF